MAIYVRARDHVSSVPPKTRCVEEHIKSSHWLVGQLRCRSLLSTEVENYKIRHLGPFKISCSSSGARNDLPSRIDRRIAWCPFSASGSIEIQIVKMSVIERDGELWEPYVGLFTVVIGPDFSLMIHNSRIPRALLIEEFLESEDIRRMDGPVGSTHDVPKQHEWDALGWEIPHLRQSKARIVERKGIITHRNS
ncbi:hypothetical protein TNCV_2948951 [Trichonephila clavipes]|nr:hypothetical protein TNCV_2948951 [Trichonephila clavipes]